MARQWVDQGATVLHLVDLDGAKAGRPINEASVRAISAVACSNVQPQCRVR